VSNESAIAPQGDSGAAGKAPTLGPPMTFRRQVRLAEAWLEAGDEGYFKEAIRVIRNAYLNSKSHRTKMRAADLLLKHGARMAEIDRQKDHGLQFVPEAPPAEATAKVEPHIHLHFERPSQGDVTEALSALMNGKNGKVNP
jgi:hypothetical protein